jgi:hypothetical protein
MDPDETLEILIAENGGDYGDCERVTLESLDEHWENQDRWPVWNQLMKAKLRELVAAGKPFWWFTIHY